MGLQTKRLCTLDRRGSKLWRVRVILYPVRCIARSGRPKNVRCCVLSDYVCLLARSVRRPRRIRSAHKLLTMSLRSRHVAATTSLRRRCDVASPSVRATATCSKYSMRIRYTHSMRMRQCNNHTPGQKMAVLRQVAKLVPTSPCVWVSRHLNCLDLSYLAFNFIGSPCMKF